MPQPMTSRERLLCALDRGKPDRLPVSLHQWQPYHLEEHLGGISALEAFVRFGMDAQIQYFESMGQFWLVESDFSKFSTRRVARRGDRSSATTRTTAMVHHEIRHAPGRAHLQDRRRPQDDLDHRIPDQARRRHPT